MHPKWIGLFTLSLALTAHAQKAPAPSLDQLLATVQSNFEAYLKSVPNLFADEHVFSSVSTGNFKHDDTRTDSIFRLKRVPMDRDFPNGLSESREVRLVNGRPSGGDNLTGPTVLYGVFSTGQQDFAPDLKECFDYKLHLNQNLRPHPQAKKMLVHVIELSLKPSAYKNKTCPITEQVTGRAMIDPKTLQVIEVDERLPDHPIYRGEPGIWTWSVEYGPEELDGKSYWMPQRITGVSVLRQGLGGRIEWSFIATYRNYHLLTVNSKILTGIEHQTTDTPR